MIVDELIYHMEQAGCYHANAEEVQKLIDTVFITKNGKRTPNRQCVGRSAKVLLGKIGVTVGDEIRCIIFEGEKTNPLIWEELMMPILGVVRVKNVDEGIEVAVELEHGNRHSAHMHSTNVNNLTKFGKAIDTAIFVKNAPSYAALGFGGEGYPTFTICSRTGEGPDFDEELYKEQKMCHGRCTFASDRSDRRGYEYRRNRKTGAFRNAGKASRTGRGTCVCETGRSYSENSEGCYADSSGKL